MRNIQRRNNLQILEPATIPELMHVWLRSEWKDEWNDPNGPLDRKLIDDPDLADGLENYQRAVLLLKVLGRQQIIQNMPEIKKAQWVAIEDIDLPKLNLVSSNEWRDATGGRYRLIDTGETLQAGGNVDRKAQAISDKLGDALTNEILILIAMDESGPYSIIDGNHRAIALYRRYLEKPDLPRSWRGILITDPWMVMSPWHVGPFAGQGDAGRVSD